MATDEAVSEPPEPRSSPLFGMRQLIIVLVISAIILAGRLTPFAPAQDAFHVFGWFTEQAIGITSDLFERWGYQTVFFAPLFENTLFIGALIPGTLVMLLAGLAVNDGSITYWWALPLAIVGAMIGDTISYSMGRWGARRIGQESRFAKWADTMREPLMKHSLWLILSYHFAGYSRLIGPAAAGYLRMPMLRWMLFDYIGVAIWVFSFITGGWLLAEIFDLRLDENNERSVQIFEVILFSFFVIAVVSVMRASSAQRKRQAEEMAKAKDPTTLD